MPEQSDEKLDLQTMVDGWMDRHGSSALEAIREYQQAQVEAAKKQYTRTSALTIFQMLVMPKLQKEAGEIWEEPDPDTYSEVMREAVRLSKLLEHLL